mmetsp:Transcript_22465/g.27449  ORF Transcript_22465/g.27449 Transcript_22465/m.27449 type:complete len:427 (+) Transcript_22465:59-1339(+)
MVILLEVTNKRLSFFAVHALKMPSKMLSFSSTAQSSVYDAPSWAKNHLSNLPKHGRLTLSNTPTPLQQISTKNMKGAMKILSDLQTNFYMKRDDMTAGVEMGGNKIRKLEFLLAEALRLGHDSVVTIGGEQSNHCRTTAAACRMVELEPHLILRTNKCADVSDDVTEGSKKLGVVGNVLFDRMVGAKIHTCTPGEYGRLGSNVLIEKVCENLRASGKNPYPIPVGGSNQLGTWGYIDGVDELQHQLKAENVQLDHVVFASGSGGTATGIALGMNLSSNHYGFRIPTIHPVGVCDDPPYFHRVLSEIASEMGYSFDDGQVSSSSSIPHTTVHQGKNLGYAQSTTDELEFITQFASDTGIVLDPVYSGKALYHFITHVIPSNSEIFRGKNILFWHTGGSLGMYEKESMIVNELDKVSTVNRLDAYNKL